MAGRSNERGGSAARGQATRDTDKSAAKASADKGRSGTAASKEAGTSASGRRSDRDAGRAGGQAFNKGDAISTLNNLLIVDYDALGLYDRVIQNLDNQDFRKQVEEFRGDHERHIRDLTAAIRDLGGEPMSRPSLMGPIAKTVASIASTLLGNKGALQALLQGEQYTNSSYRDAATGAFPESLRSLVARNASDEERHLNWVQDTLSRM